MGVGCLQAQPHWLLKGPRSPGCSQADSCLSALLFLPCLAQCQQCAGLAQCQGSASAAIRGGLVDSVCPSCDGGAAVKGVQLLLHDPLCSAPPGDVLQLSIPLRGSGLFPGPWVAASRGCGWYPAHVHSQGKRPSAYAWWRYGKAPTAPQTWSVLYHLTWSKAMIYAGPRGEARNVSVGGIRKPEDGKGQRGRTFAGHV